MNNTRDLSKFGYRELKMAAELLTALCDRRNKSSLGSGISVEFNPSSGAVFLVDEDYNVALMEDDLLLDFLSCPECGEEGFQHELANSMNKCCQEYAAERESAA